MIVNPDSASDIAKISQYLPCLVQRKLDKPFLFKKKACIISLYVLVDDFKHLTMSVFSKACVRFKYSEDFYHGSGIKTKYRFEYNESLRSLLWKDNSDNDLMWNKMC